MGYRWGPAMCWGSSILSPTTILFQWVICRVYLTIPLKGYVNLPYIRIIMRFRVSPVELCELVKCRYHHTSLVNKRVKVSMIGTHDNTKQIQSLVDLYLRFYVYLRNQTKSKVLIHMLQLCMCGHSVVFITVLPTCFLDHGK